MSLTTAPIEPLIAVKPLDGPDVFVNANPPWIPSKGTRAIFGGFLLAHAVAAAQATAAPRDASASMSGPSLGVHSLQAAFLRPGNATLPIEYRVERIADGRSSATRLVRAVQGGTQLFVATIGLARGGSGSGNGSGPLTTLVHQYGEAMPDFGRSVDPEDVSADQTPVLLRMGYTRQMMAQGPTDPYDWRHLPWTEAAGAGHQDASTFRLRSFVRLSQPLTEEAGVHLAALAFLTDEWLVATPNLTRSDLGGDGGNGQGQGQVQIQIMASMNHTILFHDATARADKAWMVSERATTWADGGRVLVQQKLWNRSTGKLVLSCWQEGWVRLARAAGTGKL